MELPFEVINVTKAYNSVHNRMPDTAIIKNRLLEKLVTCLVFIFRIKEIFGRIC